MPRPARALISLAALISAAFALMACGSGSKESGSRELTFSVFRV